VKEGEGGGFVQIYFLKIALLTPPYPSPSQGRGNDGENA